MGDQLVPDDLLGTEHIVVAGYLSPDRLQILATEDGTNVFVDGARVATLQRESHEHIFNTPSAYIETTAPVAVGNPQGSDVNLEVHCCPMWNARAPVCGFCAVHGKTMRFNIIVPAEKKTISCSMGRPVS